jgi:hypothetical protein
MTDNDTLSKIIQTTDENGEVHNFKMVEVVEVNKKEYGLFEYIDDEKSAKSSEEFEEELIVMRIVTKDNSTFFEYIEDEDEFTAVLDFIEENEDDLEFE